MKLFQVRKGQFVFYQNELHKVYSVKPMFRKSVHLYRLKDMKQILTSAPEIKYYKPKHGDTFIFYGKRYTIDKDVRAQEGDFILITRPTPDFLDHYSLNDIEKVDSVENGNVVTTRDNGIKYSEYLVLAPGREEGSTEIAYYDKTLVPEEQMIEDESVSYLAENDEALKPSVGDIYYDLTEETKAMIVAISTDQVVFGHGVRAHVSEILDDTKYELIYQVTEDL